jgi:hypothetical protein
MTLKRPHDVPGPGIVPYQYQVQINGTPTPTQLNNLVKLNTVVHSYSPQESKAQLTLWDPGSVVTPSQLPSYAMPIPKIADEVVISVQWDMNDTNRIVFRGKIDTLSDSISPDGKQYDCSVMMDSQRLNEQHVTMACNLLNDPISNPAPTFDVATGDRVIARRLTIYEIVERIMGFPDAWGTSPYFTFSDIDWGDLATHPSCGKFIPTNIVFTDAPKADAIRDTLKKAGSYDLHYDPAYGSRGRFRVVHLDLAANRCGRLWNLTYPPSAGSTSDGIGIDYASQLDIKADGTEWSSKQSANVSRVTSSPIRFYTGNQIIPEMIENTFTEDPDTHVRTAVPEVDRLRAVESDTVEMQKARAVNPDNVFYRFQDPNSLFEDTRKFQEYPVGIPLFPDWNIFEDFLPEMISVVGVSPASNLPTGVTVDDYKWQTAYEPMTRGHQRAAGLRRPSSLDNLQVYQAWHVEQECPACLGSGLVANIYTADSPNVVLRPWGHDSRRKTPVVTNYIWNPNRFGEPNPSNSNYGLSPWVSSTAQPYPIPWANTCPACRGVGWKPEYKVRNIQPDLVAGSTQANVALAGTDKSEVEIDPEYTAAGPESWGQSQARLIRRLGPQVQLEGYFGNYRLPVAPQKDVDWDTLGKLPTADQRFKFPHPLEGYIQPLATIAGVSGQNASLIPMDWHKTVTVPYTTVLFGEDIDAQIDNQMGRVIFPSPVFIAAEVRSSTIRRLYQKGAMAIEMSHSIKGMPETSAIQAGNPSRDVNGQPLGFWRPARAWLQAFYIKKGWYVRPSHSFKTFAYRNADGVNNTYMAKCMVVDGRWCVEVVKANPASWGDTPVEFGNKDRVVTTSFTDNESIVETTEADFYRMLIPPEAEMTPEELEDHKREIDCDFPRARLLRWERPTSGEVLYEVEMAETTDASEMVQQAMRRPRLYSWRLRDDRSKLMAMAVRRLESANDLLVSGFLKIRGRTIPTDEGLGYIQYPGRGRAAVVKVVHNFSNGFSTDIELTRPEARHGEMPPDDKLTLSDLRKDHNTWLATENRRRMEGDPYMDNLGAGQPSSRFSRIYNPTNR